MVGNGLEELVSKTEALINSYGEGLFDDAKLDGFYRIIDSWIDGYAKGSEKKLDKIRKDLVKIGYGAFPMVLFRAVDYATTIPKLYRAFEKNDYKKIKKYVQKFADIFVKHEVVDLLVFRIILNEVSNEKITNDRRKLYENIALINYENTLSMLDYLAYFDEKLEKYNDKSIIEARKKIETGALAILPKKDTIERLFKELNNE